MFVSLCPLVLYRILRITKIDMIFYGILMFENYFKIIKSLNPVLLFTFAPLITIGF